MCRQAVINCDADRLESVTVLIEKHFADPVPIAISKSLTFIFSSDMAANNKGVIDLKTAPYSSLHVWRH